MKKQARATVLFPFLLFLAGVVCFHTGTGLAQTTAVRPGEIQAELDSLFTLGKFNEVEIEAFRLLHGDGDASEEDRLAAWLFLGFVHVVTDKIETAQSDFRNALEINPELRLDPIYVPPLIYQTFESVRLQQQIERLTEAREQAAEDTLQEVEEADPSLRRTRPQQSEAQPVRLTRLPSVVNLLLPGTGFLAEGRVVRGLFWTSAQLGTAAGMVYSLNRSNHYRNLYYRERNPALIDDRYDRYNLWYRSSWYWGVGAGAVYLLSQVDLHLTAKGVDIAGGPGMSYHSFPSYEAYSGPAAPLPMDLHRSPGEIMGDRGYHIGVKVKLPW